MRVDHTIKFNQKLVRENISTRLISNANGIYIYTSNSNGEISYIGGQSLILVSAAIIISNHKILIAKRGKTKSLPNLWEFPGGKIEENESPETCVVREIQEELKINIKINCHYKTVQHTYEFGDIKLISFLAEYENGTIKLTEHTDYKWVNIDELHHFEFAPADIPIVNKLLEDGIEM